MGTSVFISSSTEALPVARALQSCLAQDIEATVWEHAQIPPSAYVLDGLQSALRRCRYGVFILAADDLAIVRDEAVAVARDNVLIELGLFIGVLGRERTAILIPSDRNVRVPTDLLGLVLIKYSAGRSDGNLMAALGPAANSIRIHISTLQDETVMHVTIDQAKTLGSISDTQRRIISYIADNRNCGYSDLVEAFSHIAPSELNYRLDCLRLQMFIAVAPLPSGVRLTAANIRYRLHEAFERELQEGQGDSPQSGWLQGRAPG